MGAAVMNKPQCRVNKAATNRVMKACDMMDRGLVLEIDYSQMTPAEAAEMGARLANIRGAQETLQGAMTQLKGEFLRANADLNISRILNKIETVAAALGNLKLAATEICERV